MQFLEVFKHIDNDCKFISNSKYTDYADKRELIVPLLFTTLNKLDNTRDYYIQKYIYEYQICTSPSSITKFEIVNDYIIENNLYTDYPIQRKFKYLNIEPTIQPLNSPFSNVLKSTVIEMNVLSPVICGQFFENMVSLACDLDITQDINPSPTIEEKPDDIFHFIDSLCCSCCDSCCDSCCCNVLNNSCGCNISNNLCDCNVLNNNDKIEQTQQQTQQESQQNQTKKKFKTIFHKNLAMCLFTQIVHATDLTNYFHEFIYVRELLNNSEYIKSLELYLSELKKTIIGRFKQPKKSIKVYKSPDEINEYISGESDLITDDMIIDIKCYKTEPLKLWKYQLEVYNNMIDRPKKKLMIINLLNNKTYLWEINFDSIYSYNVEKVINSNLICSNNTEKNINNTKKFVNDIEILIDDE